MGGILIALTLALLLTACGKKGPLDLPPGAAPNQYPRAYPSE